jgi:allophanate hydrolase subunit 2
VAQLKPGDQVRFEPISIENAHLLLKEQEQRLKEFRAIIGQR